MAWTRVGGIAGILLATGYLAVLFLPLPGRLLQLVFFFLPVSGILFIIGLYRLLGARRDSVALQAAVMFGAIGFAVMNLMAVVQNSIHILTRRGVPQQADPQMIDWVRRSVNSVQLGMDVSFDIFVTLSLALFGACMIAHPRFGRVFGLSGILFAGAVLALNLYSFPLPPEPDLGPLAGLWACAVAIRMLILRPPDSV